MIIERRSIIKGLIALVAAPAIVKVGSLMPVNPALQPYRMLTIEEYADRACDNWAQQHLYDEAFAAHGAKIGDTLRIRFPRSYRVTDGPGLSLRETADSALYVTLRKTNVGYVGLGLEAEPRIPAPLAIAVAAAAIAPQVLAAPVTRRFWARS